jgi:ribosomal protein L16 Arg81 hydroxylase
MVSYAAPGAVSVRVDSYDVFLLREGRAAGD